MPHKAIEVIGRACRLPGAGNLDEFWELLTSKSCSIGEIGPDRFSTFRYFHPDSGRDGKAYTFRAGMLDDVWGFDPTVFSISPREAAQMDPQQRLLLMLVWEALEEAGMPASSIAGEPVGVFVGNSGSDHANRFFFDPASSDSFMMTGNTMSLVSNRISYIYDLHGPSFTVDTACSSSLVAMDLAVKRLQSGEIHTAIVAGVNMLLSPFPFVGFSAASMLSPDGLCKPFDESANGYVRAEGAVVLILQRSDVFDAQKRKSYGRIVASGINSDGRTSGVALPSTEQQAELLKQVYDEAGIHPAQLAFIEAHGTGTRVGDPAEAFALGSVLGQGRSEPLPIGSVKSNIGHLEPASGLASVLKALMALEKRTLPASLHLNSPNPDIPFDELNLHLNKDEQSLKDADGLRYAGVNNFGFGGTNAHVLLSEARPVSQGQSSNAAVIQASVMDASDEASCGGHLTVLSAKSEEALREVAAMASRAIDKDGTTGLADWSNAFAWHRDLMVERLVVLAKDKNDLSAQLDAFAREQALATCQTGQALGQSNAPIFVFSGNGSQFAGMGQAAYQSNQAFRDSFDAVDAYFSPLAGWSLTQVLFDASLAEKLKQASCAQPLLFALQVALVEALWQTGIRPAGVMGHSVGEVAAAWACGALTLEQAVKVIIARSHHQEATRGLGGMAVLKASVEKATELLAASGFEAVEISAINTSASLSLSGPVEQLDALLTLARKQRMPGKRLDIDYPFLSTRLFPGMKSKALSWMGVIGGTMFASRFSLPRRLMLRLKRGRRCSLRLARMPFSKAIWPRLPVIKGPI